MKKKKNSYVHLLRNTQHSSNLDRLTPTWAISVFQFHYKGFLPLQKWAMLIGSNAVATGWFRYFTGGLEGTQGACNVEMILLQ